MNRIQKIFLILMLGLSNSIVNCQPEDLLIKNDILIAFELESEQLVEECSALVMEKFIKHVQQRHDGFAFESMPPLGICCSLNPPVLSDNNQKLISAFYELIKNSDELIQKEALRVVADFIQTGDARAFDKILDTMEDELEKRYIVLLPVALYNIEEINKKIANYTLSENDLMQFGQNMESMCGYQIVFEQHYKFFIEAQLYFFIPQSAQAVRMNTIMKKYVEKEKEITKLLAQSLQCMRTTLLGLDGEKINSPMIKLMREQEIKANNCPCRQINPEAYRVYELMELQKNYDEYTKFYSLLTK